MFPTTQAFKHASKHRDDKELRLLTRYLLSVAQEEDVQELDLTSWRERAKELEKSDG